MVALFSSNRISVDLLRFLFIERGQPACRKEEVQLRAFDILVEGEDDLRRLPLSMRKTNLARLLARRPDGNFVAQFEQGEIGPDLFRKACEFGVEGLVPTRRGRPFRRDGRSIGSRSRTGSIWRWSEIEDGLFT
jgi:hypothetical protein